MTAVAKSGAVAAPASQAPSGSSSTTLMPDPTPLPAGGIDAALGALYSVLSQQRQNSLQIGQTRVQFQEKAQKDAFEKQKQAEAREAAARADSGNGFFGSIGKIVSDVTDDVTHGRLDKVASDGANDVSTAVNSPAFWNDVEKGALVVAKVAATVGSVAATIASGGAAAGTLAATALLLSVSGEVVSDTQCFGKDSATIGMGLQLGGAVAGLGSGLVSLGSQAATTGLKATASTIATTANVTSAGAEGVEGAAHIENAGFAAKAQLAAADATQAVHQREAMQRLTAWVVDDMKADDKARQKGMQAAQGAIQASDQADAAAVTPVTLKG